MVSQGGNGAPEARLGSVPQAILVIDDTPAEIGMLIATLSEAGYRVRAAPDGENAFEQASSATPNLILLDVEMAGMDGFETCRRLRQLPKLIETPVIFMIELSEPQDRVGAYAAGGDDYVTKPFQYQEVLARVRLHLRHRALEFELEQLYRQFDKRVAERTVALKAAIAESEALRNRLQQQNHALKEEIRRRDNVK
jgi:DNA-binding response OmpR family regulator